MKRSQSPQSLQSARFGQLALHEDEDSSGYSCHYTAPYNHPACGEIEVVFYPRGSDPSCWGEELIDAEHRADVLLSSLRAILLSGESHFAELFSDYNLEETKIDDLLPSLNLSLLNLDSILDDELVYAPCHLFPCFDLYVSVDRDLRFTEIHFDG